MLNHVGQIVVISLVYTAANFFMIQNYCFLICPYIKEKKNSHTSKLQNPPFIASNFFLGERGGVTGFHFYNPN